MAHSNGNRSTEIAVAAAANSRTIHVFTDFATEGRTVAQNVPVEHRQDPGGSYARLMATAAADFRPLLGPPSEDQRCQTMTVVFTVCEVHGVRAIVQHARGDPHGQHNAELRAQAEEVVMCAVRAALEKMFEGEAT